MTAREKRLLRLRLYALAIVESEGPEGIALGDLLKELQHVERSDENVSEALSHLQSFGRLKLTVGRRMVMPEQDRRPGRCRYCDRRFDCATRARPNVVCCTRCEHPDGDGMVRVRYGKRTYLVPFEPIDLDDDAVASLVKRCGHDRSCQCDPERTTKEGDPA